MGFAIILNLKLNSIKLSFRQGQGIWDCSGVLFFFYVQKMSGSTFSLIFNRIEKKCLRSYKKLLSYFAYTNETVFMKRNKIIFSNEIFL